MNTFLAGISASISVLALLVSGVTAYQVFTLKQTLTTQSTVNSQVSGAIASAPPPQAGAATASSPSSETTASSSTTAVQPGQFVKSALRNKAEVELLRVNRIPGQANTVNVQVRIRALQPDKTVGSDVITMSGATARNPQTSETYSSIPSQATGGVSLFLMGMEKQPSADAYVWLQIPDDVKTIDLYLPNTEAFTGVPIADS